jgi:hypothetical protein
LADANLPRYNKNYYSVQLVELLPEAEITPDLFNPEECRGEVVSWFKEKNKT